MTLKGQAKLIEFWACLFNFSVGVVSPLCLKNWKGVNRHYQLTSATQYTPISPSNTGMIGRNAILKYKTNQVLFRPKIAPRNIYRVNH